MLRAVTVQQVQKDPDGSYDVMGTKAGAPVKVLAHLEPGPDPSLAPSSTTHRALSY